MLGLLAILFMAAAAAAPYPDRPGKKTVEKICGACHGLKLMEPMRRTRAAWQTSIDDMLTRGMKAEESEIEEAVNYFARYFSRLNINKATAAEIADVLDLPAPQAEALVRYREKNGPIPNYDALEKVPGLDAKKLSEQRDRIAFRQAAF
ncbi:MAG: helix-hairpin-helix domain-containing protein [Acidobacteria bacterium]|nr:helix-hairpin-helix domain-containing protein [Acidobacteriota bacterium]